MKPPSADINIRDNYLSFHHKSIYEYNILEKKLTRLKSAKEETWNNLIPYKESIANQFRIVISQSIDFITLGEKLNKQFRKNDSNDRQEILMLLIKYCSIIKNEVDTKKAFELADKKRNLSFSEYRLYVFKYYSQVHKILLEGKAYRYLNGIGTLYIHRVQVVADGHKIDFHKTKLRKQELLSKGVKLYNKYEAAQYEAQGIPYDGVDYRVWLRTPAYYSLKFIHSKYFRQEYDFIPISYIHSKYREYNQDQLAFEVCQTNDDVYDLQIDLKTKIAIYLKRNPERFVDFDRNITNEE